MRAFSRILPVLLLLPFLLLLTACDGLVSGPGGGEEEGPVLTRADVLAQGRQIMAHFSEPLDPATVAPGVFRISSALDNGRGYRGTPTAARYVGGPSNSVELTVPGAGLGNGAHTLTATGVHATGGEPSGETSVSFEYRITINTPKSFIVRKIVVKAFPGKKSNGNTWDWDPLSSTERRPDIYVSFQRPGALPLFVSNTHKNASSSKDYTFDRAASSNDPGVPFEARYNTEYQLSLVDDDFGGNETMVSARFKFSSLYRLDNATSDKLTVSGNRGFEAVIHGDWTY